MVTLEDKDADTIANYLRAILKKETETFEKESELFEKLRKSYEKLSEAVKPCVVKEFERANGLHIKSKLDFEETRKQISFMLELLMGA